MKLIVIYLHVLVILLKSQQKADIIIIQKHL